MYSSSSSDLYNIENFPLFCFAYNYSAIYKFCIRNVQALYIFRSDLFQAKVVAFITDKMLLIRQFITVWSLPANFVCLETNKNLVVFLVLYQFYEIFFQQLVYQTKNWLLQHRIVIATDFTKFLGFQTVSSASVLN